MLDFLIKDGFVVDGSGAPMFKADVGILKGKIVRVEKNIQEEAKNLIEANNLIVSPGFIDIHTHDDYSILVNPYAENKIMQGVTTDVMGNCGKSPFPVKGAYVERLRKRVELRMGYVLEWNDFSSYIKVVASKKPAINLVPLTGHNGLRAGVIGYDDRKPTSRELSEMKELLEKTLEKGSFGMSTGLIYPPGLFSTIQELIELSKVIKKYNGIYASHIRGEANTLISAVREAIQIGEETGVSVEISHHKACGVKNFGNIKITISMIETARRKGMDINFDVYPYTASWTNSGTILPPWALDGGMIRTLQRLRDDSLREKMKEDIEKRDCDWENPVENATWKGIVLLKVNRARNRVFEGKTIFRAARMLRKEPADFLFDLIINEGYFQDILVHEISEEDVITVLKHPLSMVGSDSPIFVSYERSGRPHPRFFGTFPRIIHRYVKKMRVLKLEEAVKKMTSMPAQKLGLKSKGLIKEGYDADITIFDFRRIRDKATFSRPMSYPIGIKYVMVNGVLVVDDGEPTRARPGRVILKKRK